MANPLLSEFDSPVPGEALTVEPGKYPYEQPPQFADPEEALDFLFRRIMQPRSATQSLALMESGVPLNILVETLLMQGFGEGLWSAPMTFLMAGPMTVILARMAEAAGVDYKLSSDEPDAKQPSDALVFLARKRMDTPRVGRAVDAATKSAPELVKTFSVMKRSR